MKLIKLNYSVTSTRVGKYPESNKDNKPSNTNIPGWLHIDPINTQIDIDSVAYQLSNYKYTEGMIITTEDLTNPKYTDYPADPKFK